MVAARGFVGVAEESRPPRSVVIQRRCGKCGELSGSAVGLQIVARHLMTRVAAPLIRVNIVAVARCLPPLH